MAKKKAAEAAPVVAPVVRGPNAVRLADGQYAEADAPYQVRDPEIHIAGVPYVHVADTDEGAWIYAPRNVAQR